MTPDEYADSITTDWRSNGLRQSVINAITAAVAAEHQRTLEQAAKVVKDVYIGSSQQRIVEAIRALP